MTSLSEEDETRGDGGEDTGGKAGNDKGENAADDTGKNAGDGTAENAADNTEKNAADDTGDDTSPFRERPDVTTEQALAVLAAGEISMVGRMPWSSNATFLVDVDAPGELDFSVQAVYKPVRGERRLWDFPPGLHRRERACFVLSEALGWGLVPPTIIRDGPLGEGSLQLFVLADFEHHYFTIRQIDSLDLPLRRLCAFDFVSNATDRKSGHVLLRQLGCDEAARFGGDAEEPLLPPDELPSDDAPSSDFSSGDLSSSNAPSSDFPSSDLSSSDLPATDTPSNDLPYGDLSSSGAPTSDFSSGDATARAQIFAIDNGLSFHSDFKLRTVLWDFSGEPLPQCVMADLTAFLASPASAELAEVLTDAELDAAMERAELLLESAVFPTDPSGQRWPWPVV